MIQRKQSLYLFIAALLNAGVLFFDQYRFVTQSIISGVTVNTPMQIKVADHYPSILIALVMILLPLITIFMYGDRKRQLRMCFVSTLAALSFITITLTRISKIMPVPASGSYWIGSILPAIALVFIILAVLGIRRDEKLVKSVDRLR